MVAITDYTITVCRPFEIAAHMLLSAQKHHGKFLIEIKVFFDARAYFGLQCNLVAPIKMNSAGVGMGENQYNIAPKITVWSQHVGKSTETQHDIVLTRRR